MIQYDSCETSCQTGSKVEDREQKICSNEIWCTNSVTNLYHHCLGAYTSPSCSKSCKDLSISSIPCSVAAKPYLASNGCRLQQKPSHPHGSDPEMISICGFRSRFLSSVRDLQKLRDKKWRSKKTWRHWRHCRGREDIVLLKTPWLFKAAWKVGRWRLPFPIPCCLWEHFLESITSQSKKNSNDNVAVITACITVSHI